MSAKLGIPYMGSKRKIAREIVNYILEYNPNCKYFYDLFGGGGAISLEALQRVNHVFYNDLNTGVVELFKMISKTIPRKCYEWVSREKFFECYKDSDWYGGYVKSCWSFANDQQHYLYGKSIEEFKMKLHEIVVNKSMEYANEYNIPLEFLNYSTIEERRLGVRRLGVRRLGELEHLERLNLLIKINKFLTTVDREITFSNLSYEQIEIDTPTEETVIYLDPPYKGTRKYQLDANHEQLYSYIESSPYKVYLSEYDSPLRVVKEINHISTFKNNKRVVERLYCNR